MGAQAPWGTDRDERERSGKYAKSPPCDACGKSTGRAYGTDDEACDGGDGPGFYLCARARCQATYAGKSVEERREIFARGRAHHPSS